MAPLLPSNTARYRFDYTVNGVDHDFQIRSGGSPSQVGLLVDDFLTELAPELFALVINQVSHAVQGSNIFLPVTTGIENTTYGSGAGVYEQKAWYIDFVGRSASGRRWRLAIFGIRTMGGDFRYTPLENAAVTAAVAVLQAAPSPTLIAIDETAINVYGYANAGVNAYWQRALRP